MSHNLRFGLKAFTTGATDVALGLTIIVFKENTIVQGTQFYFMTRVILEVHQQCVHNNKIVEDVISSSICP